MADPTRFQPPPFGAMSFERPGGKPPRIVTYTPLSDEERAARAAAHEAREAERVAGLRFQHAALLATHEGALHRVIAIHHPDDEGYCEECTVDYCGPTGIRWPCNTINAITGEEPRG